MGAVSVRWLKSGGTPPVMVIVTIWPDAAVHVGAGLTPEDALEALTLPAASYVREPRAYTRTRTRE